MITSRLDAAFQLDALNDGERDPQHLATNLTTGICPSLIDS